MNRRGVLALSVAASAFWLAPARTARGAVIPPFFLDCVVALGFFGPETQNGVLVPDVWHTIGTGFFYGHLETNDADPAKRQYSTYLVTAKHVVDDYEGIKKENPKNGSLDVRVNPLFAGAPVTYFDIRGELSQGLNDWTFNPNGKDVAAIPIDMAEIRAKNDDSSFFCDDAHVAQIGKLRDIGASEGDGIFVLGFPMGMIGSTRDYVIAREGVIARIRDMLDDQSDSFLVDSFVFPGNSGGPVVLKPEMMSISGTKSNLNAYVIGLVIQETPYVDTAFSLQTKHPRITFEENAGLSVILPMDYVDAAVMAARATAKEAAPPAKPTPPRRSRR